MSNRTGPRITPPEITITHEPSPRANTTDPPGRVLLQAAFRDLHGARLHGFCLLLSLGERAPAASAAAAAISRALPRLAELRHPERAAAWLRATAMAGLGAARKPREPEGARRETLRSLGVTDASFDGLASLHVRERAAFVATDVERLDPIDVEMILSADAATTRRLVNRGRRRYLVAAALSIERQPMAGGEQPDAPPGGLTGRIEAAAERAIGGTWSSG